MVSSHSTTKREKCTVQHKSTSSPPNSPPSYLSQIVIFNHYSLPNTKRCGPFLLFLRFTVNMSRHVHGRTYPVAEAHSDLMRLLSVKKGLSLSTSSIYEHKRVQEQESGERSCCFWGLSLQFYIYTEKLSDFNAVERSHKSCFLLNMTIKLHELGVFCLHKAKRTDSVLNLIQ